MDISRRTKIFLITLALLNSVFQLYGVGTSTQFASQGVPVFRNSLYKILSEDGQNFYLEIHADISNDRLQFIKKGSEYRSSYSVSVAVFEGRGSRGIPLHQDSEVKYLSVNDYSETLLPSANETHHFKYELEKGDYTVVIVFKDLNSGKSHTLRSRQEFTDSSDIIVSDLRMVKWDQDDDFIDEYEPVINNVVDKQQDFTGAFFQVYNRSSTPLNFDVRYRIRGIEGEIVYDNSFQGFAGEGIKHQVLKIPLENLRAGNYRIESDITISGKKYFRSTSFYLRWKDISINVPDIQTALEQMLYVVEYDSVKDVFSKTEEEQMEWFKNFWNGLEQRLSLKTNTLMEEYFRRISYANMYFSVPKKDGWKTDMGKVLSVMGDPDEIQNYPFIKNQRPYEVWTYYDINTQFIFDYIGGEYRLRK